MKKKSKEESKEAVEAHLKKAMELAKEGDVSVLESALTYAQRYAEKAGVDITKRVKELCRS